MMSLPRFRRADVLCHTTDSLQGTTIVSLVSTLRVGDHHDVTRYKPFTGTAANNGRDPFAEFRISGTTCIHRPRGRSRVKRTGHETISIKCRDEIMIRPNR